jgi:D-glycero-D-manno-heptose 1,7-bisphosphate phosphatase
MAMTKRAVFLDRDGTLNVDVGYPSQPGQVEIYPHSYRAVRKIRRAGLLTIVVTNQSGIGRGLLTESDLSAIHQKMSTLFSGHRARIDAFYYCPHYEHSKNPLYREKCSCRKPDTGLALRAAADFDLDLKCSYMVGDKVEDVLFGLNIGAVPVLVLTGSGPASLLQLRAQGIEPAGVVADILGAAEWICQREKETVRR